jgi:MFS family permease
MGLLSAPATWLMGQVTVIWQLIGLTATVWFVAGITLTLIAIIAGERTHQHERGRVFGLLGLTTALGGVLGGATGLIADRWGYAALFTLAAGVWLLQCGAAAFLDNSGTVATANATQRARVSSTVLPPVPPPVPLGSAFYLLLLAALCYAIGSFVGNLGRSLVMDAQGFPATALTMTIAIGSAVSMVVNPLLGRLSDRVNRWYLLALIYGVGVLALVIMTVTTTLTGFALVGVLMAVSGAERAVSSALVSDLLPAAALSRGLSLFDAAKWLGGVVGFAGTGFAVQQLGLTQALMASLVLPLLAILLLLVRQGHAALTKHTHAPGVHPVTGTVPR